VLVVVVIAFPHGLQGGVRWLARWLRAGSARSRDGNGSRADVKPVTTVSGSESDSVLRGGPDGD